MLNLISKTCPRLMCYSDSVTYIINISLTTILGLPTFSLKRKKVNIDEAFYILEVTLIIAMFNNCSHKALEQLHKKLEKRFFFTEKYVETFQNLRLGHSLQEFFDYACECHLQKLVSKQGYHWAFLYRPNLLLYFDDITK